ncbi:hypothetical protein ACPA9J_25810 [Pseudomonas aeruginosa]
MRALVWLHLLAKPWPSWLRPGAGDLRRSSPPCPGCRARHCSGSAAGAAPGRIGGAQPS